MIRARRETLFPRRGIDRSRTLQTSGDFVRPLLGSIILLIFVGCGSLPTLRNRVGTGLNIQDVAESDLNKACKFDKDGRLVSGPGWCVACNRALHANDEATHLGLRAMKNAGRAPWQRRRLKNGRAAVEGACPSVSQ